MKVLLVHNYYQQAGGEDICFADEGRILEERGHAVLRYTRENADIPRIGAWKTARQALWNRRTYRELREIIRRERPQVMHCTNIFPLISPAAYHAAREQGVVVVQDLQNFRLLCANALLMRDGHVCEDCVGKVVPWPSVVHGCYRGSRAASAAVATMLSVHRARRTWTSAVDLFYTPTEFARQKLLQANLPANKIVVKPNCVHPDPGVGAGCGGYAVFVGRLSPEKGISTLLEAWSRRAIDVPLKIVGDGPLAEQVRSAAATNPAIQWLGWRPLDEALSIVGDAVCLVMPSIWYETFGRTIVEAFAKGTPVIASKLGAMAELVDDGRTGCHFAAGDATDLVSKLRAVLADPIKLREMREAARHEYERKYTADSNYRMLMAIYGQALAARGMAMSEGEGAKRNGESPPDDSPLSPRLLAATEELPLERK